VTGVVVAAEMELTRKSISAARAHQLGLVDQGTATETAHDVVLAFTDSVAHDTHRPVRESKTLLDNETHSSTWESQVYPFNQDARSGPRCASNTLPQGALECRSAAGIVVNAAPVRHTGEA
jgi:enoyl-CoA hydratase/carnithine racemase